MNTVGISKIKLLANEWGQAKKKKTRFRGLKFAWGLVFGLCSFFPLDFRRQGVTLALLYEREKS
jgi:hypothetical protein